MMCKDTRDRSTIGVANIILSRTGFSILCSQLAVCPGSRSPYKSRISFRGVLPPPLIKYLPPGETSCVHWHRALSHFAHSGQFLNEGPPQTESV